MVDKNSTPKIFTATLALTVIVIFFLSLALILASFRSVLPQTLKRIFDKIVKDRHKSNTLIVAIFFFATAMPIVRIFFLFSIFIITIYVLLI